MYEKILEKNLGFIKSQKIYRSFDTEIQKVVHILNIEKIINISGLRHTGKTQLIHLLVKKTKSLDETFYFNAELDDMNHIDSREELTILFDLCVRIYGVPKIIVFENVRPIVGIKSFIGDLYKTKKYKIITVGNTLNIKGIQDVQIFPMGIETSNTQNTQYGGIPQVRIVPDTSYKNFVLGALSSDILLKDLHNEFAIKNMRSLTSLLHYLASSHEYQSLREIHRSLKDHGVDISLLTMIDYINACLQSKLLHRSHLYDIKNDNTITSKAQYYFGDVGLKHNFGNKNNSLENLIYLEFLIHGFKVSGGLNGRFQFAVRAVKGDIVFSVAMGFSSDKTEIRKTARKLEKIGDNSLKFVVVQNKNSLKMRKFEEGSVRIIEVCELLEILRK